jgi:hypothetical protein
MQLLAGSRVEQVAARLIEIGRKLGQPAAGEEGVEIRACTGHALQVRPP